MGGVKATGLSPSVRCKAEGLLYAQVPPRALRTKTAQPLCKHRDHTLTFRSPPVFIWQTIQKPLKSRILTLLRLPMK